MIGQTVSQYQILEKLGQVGAGEVYLAQDIELDRKVTLKFLPTEEGSESSHLGRFVREAKSAARLNHPNIATVYKVGEHLGHSFVAMEYVEGRTLLEMIATEAIVPREALSIAIQICDGLSAAHMSGTLHPYIRSDTILIGHGGRARLTHFGLAAGTELSPNSPDTSAFRAPELQGGEVGDERADVYSIGALLGAMDAENHFEEIVSRAMAERPDDRYPTVEALAADLMELQSLQFSDTKRGSLTQSKIKPFAVGILLLLAFAILWVWNPFERDGTVTDKAQRRIIAVLPFDNLGDADDEYFADGITDEITSRLSLMQGLGVISRTSSRTYKNTQKSVREIGDELNADFVIEGTIRWDKTRDSGRVRITPQLIRVADDTHVWAHSYEREITEIFTVQADIATQIAEALNVELLENERQALSAEPTESIDAYQAYLRGMKLLDAPDFSRESFVLGQQMFERAITLDPGFALAYARLSSMHSRMYHYGFDRTNQRLEMARSAFDQAFALQPDLAEAHLAQGYFYYWVHRDYDRALKSLDAARTLKPNSGEIRQAIAYVKRRQGDLVMCAQLLEQDLELNPLGASAAVALGETYGTLRNYPEGERSFKYGIALAPDNVYPYTELALLYLRWRGDAAAARATLERLPSVANTEYFRTYYFVELFDRNHAAALEHLDACPDQVLEAGAFFIPVPMLEGVTFQLTGETERARSSFEVARVILEERLAQDPEDYRVNSALGITYAGLGMARDAMRHGERAVDLYPMSRDALEAPVMIIDLALIYTMIGEHESAIQQLDYVLSIPSILSAPWLEKDPRWDPLRPHPQFAALLQKYSIDSGY